MIKKLSVPHNSDQVIQELDKIKLKTECPFILQYTDCFEENIYCFFVSDFCQVYLIN